MTDTSDQPVVVTGREFDLRFEITTTLLELPMAEAVGIDLRYDRGDLLTWLAAVLEWINGYTAFARTAAAGAREMSAELDTLRAQREAIRSFLGTTKGDQ